MSAGSSTLGGSGEMGKGLFGYRKSDVDQMLADRDTMLRQAEGRIRASEARILELEKTVADANERKARVEEQVRRLRQEYDTISARTNQGEQVAEEVRAEAGKVRAEAERMASWRLNIQGIVEAMVPTMDRFRALANDIPNRMDQAFSPLGEKVSALMSLIEEFARLSGSA